MKASERFPRSLIVKIAIGSLSILALSMFFLWRVHQGKSDICVENGRILNPGELRQAVLQNLVNIEVEATNVQEGLFNAGTEWVGIVRVPEEAPRDSTEVYIKKIMEKAYKNDLSFEDNFSIEVIAPSENGFDVSRLEEPFMLVRYSTRPHGSATFYMSTDVRAAVPSWQPKTSLFERFRGFGNHYFLIKRIFINRECCDNRDYGRKREKYLDDKRKDYMASLENFDRGIAVHDNFVMISNCGDIRTEKSEDGMDRDLIKFIYGRKETVGAGRRQNASEGEQNGLHDHHGGGKGL
jgi:hypothetical protein